MIEMMSRFMIEILIVFVKNELRYKVKDYSVNSLFSLSQLFYFLYQYDLFVVLFDSTT